MLTQPDAPAGRGRGLRPAPAKLKAMQLGLPVVEQPRRPARRRDDRARRLRAADPARTLLERHLWLNVHPSLLPRWRGAAPVERAIMAGDEETGVTSSSSSRSSTPGRSPRSEAFPIGPEDDAGSVYDRAAERRRRAARARAARARRSTPQPEEGVTYAEKIGPDDRALDLSRPEEAVNRVRALSPHIGARAELHGRPVTVWRARVEDGAVRPARGAAAGRPAHGLRRVAQRVFGERPRAGPPTRSSSASSRTTRTPTARSPSAAEELDARDRALAQRIAYGTVQRVRALDHGIETLGRRPVRKLDPPVRAALRLGAYQLGYLDGRAARGRERVGRARPGGAARAGRPVHERGDAAARRDGLRELLDALPEGPLKHSYPDWIYETWVRDWGEEEALALMRAQNEPPETVVRLVRGEIRRRADRRPGRIPRRARRRARARRGTDLAAEPRLAARRARVGSRAGERDPRPLRRARAARRRCSRGEVVAVELHEGRARELEENARRLGATNVRVVNADGARAAAGARRASTARSSTRRARGSASSPAGPICAGARSRCPSSSSRCSARRPSASGPAGRSSTRSAR